MNIEEIESRISRIKFPAKTIYEYAWTTDEELGNTYWYYEAALGKEEVGSFEKHMREESNESYKCFGLIMGMKKNLGSCLLHSNKKIRELARIISE